jgi:hypothetical protein
MYRIFEDMFKRGLISSSNYWIEKAIAQRHTRLPLGIAYSRLLVFDRLDRKMIKLTSQN